MSMVRFSCYATRAAVPIDQAAPLSNYVARQSGAVQYLLRSVAKLWQPAAMLWAFAAFAISTAQPRESAAWMQCLADEAARFARSSEAADIAADAAMGACTEQEGALIAAERRSVSNSGLAALERAQSDGRAVMRQRVIARIVELRTPR